ncbi:MAG: hypothetical protein JW994_00115, partial [Candidatus Omnitrophica bacterium]|nr:hypothetical protein [Candidatus Omnitrophota bacterium]
LILYTLSERLPCTKYYEILPGVTTQKNVQEEVADSLARYGVNFIVLQDIELPRPDASGTEGKMLFLDDYIAKNFRPVKKIGKFNIYEKI